MKKLVSLFFAAAMLLAPCHAWAGQGRILKIDFKSAITEHGSSSFSLASLSLGSLGTGSISLLNMVRAIDAAATDPSVSMIYMTPDNISAGMAQMEEVRAALARFRASGKQIVAYCENLSNASYYIASVADKVILNPASENYLLGLGTQQVFLKDALDALGVEVQLIRHGKYKSAGEMYTRSDFSPENYEQYSVMINSLWNAMCNDIAGSRSFTADEFRGWVNDLTLTDAESFLEKGLVDELWHKDQVEDYFCEQSGFPMIKLVKFVSLKRYSDKLNKSFKKKNRRNKDKVAVVYANGEIVVSPSGTSMSSELIIGKNLAATLAKVRKDDKIKAVVFRVNFPGGSVMASELIRREVDLLQAAKPVIASYGEYAASGGYWISTGTDRIFTDRTTLTGSIGCFSLVPNLGGAIRSKLKVNFATVNSSDHSDMMSGMRHLDDSEVAYLQSQVEYIYDRFTTLVSDGRGISKDSVDVLGQGRVWAGSDALGIGLVDEIGGLNEAIAYAAQTAGLTSYGVVEYPEIKPFNLMALLGEEDDVEETLTSDNDPSISAMLQRCFPYAAALRRKCEPVMMARMTAAYSFN